MIYMNESMKLKDTSDKRHFRYIVKLKETNMSRSSATESKEEKPVRFLSCVQHATGHPMIKLMASVEFIGDQSRDPDLHCVHGKDSASTESLSRFRQKG